MGKINIFFSLSSFLNRGLKKDEFKLKKFGKEKNICFVIKFRWVDESTYFDQIPCEKFIYWIARSLMPKLSLVDKYQKVYLA